ncbi:hypothetical protein FQR65_LT20389 [Abscondita terminalis]|nr:hypothetical protein FQR65_LT20389 [Abscondita terminalis]
MQGSQPLPQQASRSGCSGGWGMGPLSGGRGCHAGYCLVALAGSPCVYADGQRASPVFSLLFVLAPQSTSSVCQSVLCLSTRLPLQQSVLPEDALDFPLVSRCLRQLARREGSVLCPDFGSSRRQRSHFLVVIVSPFAPRWYPVCQTRGHPCSPRDRWPAPESRPKMIPWEPAAGECIQCNIPIPMLHACKTTLVSPGIVIVICSTSNSDWVVWRPGRSPIEARLAPLNATKPQRQTVCEWNVSTFKTLASWSGRAHRGFSSFINDAGFLSGPTAPCCPPR